MLIFRRPVLFLLFPVPALERAQLDGPRDVVGVDAVAGRGVAGPLAHRRGVLHERQVPRAELLHEELQPIRILLKQAAEI